MGVVGAFLYEFSAFLSNNFRWKVKGKSRSTIKIYWAEPSGIYDIYKVKYQKRGTGNDVWSSVITREPGRKSVTIRNLDADAEYEIKIKDKGIPNQQYLEPKFARTLPPNSTATPRGFWFGV